MEQNQINWAQKEQELLAREQALLKRELKATVLEQLAARGLPKELADTLPYESEEGAMLALDQLEQAFRKAVQQSVDERLKGQTPQAGTPTPTDADKLSDNDYYRTTMG